MVAMTLDSTGSMWATPRLGPTGEIVIDVNI
jgi:hypothetical protein